MTLCEMRVMSNEGDTKISWDPDNPHEVAVARRTFDELVGGKRFLAYAVRGGGKGEVVREFDPDEQQLILAPPLVGG